MSARSYLYARGIRVSPLYRRKKPRLAKKRVRYVTPYTRPRGSQATLAHLPAEIQETILGPSRTRFEELLSNSWAIEWKKGAWVPYKYGSYNTKGTPVHFPHAEGRYLLRKAYWNEGGKFGQHERWYLPGGSWGRQYSGRSEINEMRDFIDSLEQGGSRTRYAAVIDQDAERPYLWRVSRPTGGNAREFAYVKPSELVSLLNRNYVYVDASTATKRKYKIYGA